MKDKYIIYFLSKTRKKMISYIATRLKKEGIKDIDPSYGNIFTALFQNNGTLTMKEITEFVGKDKSTITSHIKQLSQNGYIRKEQSKLDKRVINISLTDKGWQFQKIYESISSEIYQYAYRDFTEEEKIIFLSLLKRMNNNFNF